MLLRFHSAMAVYSRRLDQGWALGGVTPCESGLLVLPRALRESDLPRLGRWIREQVDKCVRCPRHSPVPHRAPR